MYKYQELHWDTVFFGFKVAKIEQSKVEKIKLNATLKDLELNGYRLVYVSVKNKISLSDNHYPNYVVQYVDEKITYLKKKINAENYDKNIIDYELMIPSEQMLSLAVQSGVYSRFNFDKKIGKKKFEELYKLWMINSVNKTIANSTLVYKKENNILGMVTLSDKNGIADIGIISVDENSRGMGIGLFLIKAAEKWAMDNNYNEIQVVTQGFNNPACKLYEKRGFKKQKVENFFHFWLNNKKV